MVSRTCAPDVTGVGREASWLSAIRRRRSSSSRARISSAVGPLAPTWVSAPLTGVLFWAHPAVSNMTVATTRRLHRLTDRVIAMCPPLLRCVDACSTQLDSSHAVGCQHSLQLKGAIQSSLLSDDEWSLRSHTHTGYSTIRGDHTGLSAPPS